MANYVYPAILIEGGAGSGSLKDIDGAALADKDVAFVAIQGGGVFHYILDVDSAATEAIPNIVTPTSNGGDKRWILHDVATSSRQTNELKNIGLAATVGSAILTVALKGEDGNDPSATNPVVIAFRDETLTTGTPNVRTVTAETHCHLSSGSTLGFGGNVSQYPLEQSDTYVKATSKVNTSYWPYFATDPAKSLTGTSSANGWLSENLAVTNQRFHIDLGSAKIITRIYLENYHSSGDGTETIGVQNFTVQGSNTGTGTFDDLVYANDEGWTNITASITHWEKHPTADAVDPQYCTLTNTTAYRYYALKFADNYGSASYMGVRRIELQVSDSGRIYTWAIDNAGTVELALSRTADIFPESNLVSTTAEGGAGAADSATVMYSTTARTNVACRCIGYIEITTGAVPGEWDNAPTKVQVMGPGVKRTGDIIQTLSVTYGTYASCATRIPGDNTIPQITEGDEVLTKAITPTSAFNTLIACSIVAGTSTAADAYTAALFNGGVNAIAACLHYLAAGGYGTSYALFNSRVAGGVSPITYSVRVGGHGNNFALNSHGSPAGAVMNGTDTTYLTIQEVMA